MTAPSTDARQVLARCDELAELSSSSTGIDRRYLTPEHAKVNALVGTWMEEAGLAPRQDAAGNLRGRLEGSRPGLPALLLASHLDSVPDAGRYDGILGVMAALAAARRLAPMAGELPFALEVIAFGDEEGTRFGATLLGSRALAGTWDEAWWQLQDEDGVSLRQAFLDAGLDPEAVGEAALSPEEVAGYLEVHIEQGPRLEEEDRALGVVSGIAGAMRAIVTLEGDARHCATPYSMRRDALLGACEQILEVDRIARAADCPVTVGRIAVEPGAVNVVAGTAVYSIDLRSPDDAVRARTWEEIRSRITALAGRRGLGIEVAVTHEAPATLAHPVLADAFRAGIVATGDAEPVVLPSIAGHDAMAVASITGIGMLFVRCGGGISHHPDESVREDDVALALDALEHAVREVAARS